MGAEQSVGVILLFCGALLPPARYLAVTRMRGPNVRLMALGAAVQIGVSVVVWVGTELLRGPDADLEWFWLVWIVVPGINLLALVYYGYVLFWSIVESVERWKRS